MLCMIYICDYVCLEQLSHSFGFDEYDCRSRVNYHRVNKENNGT